MQSSVAYSFVVLSHPSQQNLDAATGLVNDLIQTVLDNHLQQQSHSHHSTVYQQTTGGGLHLNAPSLGIEHISTGYVYRNVPQQAPAGSYNGPVHPPPAAVNVAPTRWNGMAPPRPPPTQVGQSFPPVPHHSTMLATGTAFVPPAVQQQSLRMHQQYTSLPAHSLTPLHPAYAGARHPPPRPQRSYSSIGVAPPALQRACTPKDAAPATDNARAAVTTPRGTSAAGETSTPPNAPSGQLHVPEEYEKIKRAEFIGPALPWCIPKIEYDDEHKARLLGKTTDTPELQATRAATTQVRLAKAARANPITFAKAATTSIAAPQTVDTGGGPVSPPAETSMSLSSGAPDAGQLLPQARGVVRRRAPMQGWSTTEHRYRTPHASHGHVGLSTHE